MIVEKFPQKENDDKRKNSENKEPEINIEKTPEEDLSFEEKAIREVQDFETLYETIRDLERGSKNPVFYEAAPGAGGISNSITRLKLSVEQIRNGEKGMEALPNVFGLREKVSELLEKEKEEVVDLTQPENVEDDKELPSEIMN